MTCIDIDENTMVVCQRFNGITMLDATAPEMPTVAGSLDLGNAADAVLHAGVVLVTDASLSTRGMRVVDYTDINAPAAGALLATTGTPTSIAALDEYAYVGITEGRVVAVDVRDTTTPIRAGTLPLLDAIVDVSVEGEFVYVATRDRGLMVLRAPTRDVP